MCLCLSLLQVCLPTVADALQNLFPVLVQLELGDFNFRRGNSERDGLAIALLAAHSLNVYDVFQAVDRCDLALAAFVCSAFDDYFVVFADGDGAHLLFKNV